MLWRQCLQAVWICYFREQGHLSASNVGACMWVITVMCNESKKRTLQVTHNSLQGISCAQYPKKDYTSAHKADSTWSHARPKNYNCITFYLLSSKRDLATQRLSTSLPLAVPRGMGGGWRVLGGGWWQVRGGSQSGGGYPQGDNIFTCDLTGVGGGWTKGFVKPERRSAPPFSKEAK